jgi:hypothetical protein
MRKTLKILRKTGFELQIATFVHTVGPDGEITLWIRLNLSNAATKWSDRRASILTETAPVARDTICYP